MEVKEQNSIDEQSPEENFNPLFEKERESLSEANPKSQSVAEVVSFSKTDEMLPSESINENISDKLFTSHPITMKVENSKIKMVDLTQTIISYRDIPIAPDGFIPNSEIRLILKRPFEDCLPPKKVIIKSKKDETKRMLEEILLKFLPEDLVTEPQTHIQTMQDMALLAESKTARTKGVVTLEDNEELNRDLVDQIDEEDMEGLIQNISMRSSKSKRKKYARQITKAAMLNQLERKVKEKEEKRREQMLKEEEKLKHEREEEQRSLLEEDKSRELVDIDILDTLDKNLNDDTSREKLIAQKKEKEQKKLEAAYSKINTKDLMNMLFQMYGEERAYKIFYGAFKNDNLSINYIDSVVKTRQNRLMILNAVMTNPYIFPYVSYNLEGEDKLINVAIMMDDSSLIDKTSLSSMQEKVADILGDETKMVQYLSKLSWALNCANEKLKLIIDESHYDLLLDVFSKKEEALDQLKTLLGGVEKRESFIKHIKNCEDVEIQNFPLHKDQIKKKPSVTKIERRKSQIKGESDVDFYGNLTDEERKLLPALPGASELAESPAEFASRIANVLQSKHKKEIETLDITDTTEMVSKATSTKDSKMKKTAKVRSVNEEMLSDADKAVQKSLSGVQIKKPKYLDDIAKSELGAFMDEVEPSKSLKIVGQHKIIEDGGNAKKKFQTQSKIKSTDLLTSYHERLIKQDWWSSDIKIEITADSMLLALVLMLYTTGKLANHSDICQFIIEIKRMFPISKETKNEAINKLYEYFKEDREGAIKAMNERNQSSHIFYCKRVLNVLSVLKSLDEDIDEFKEEFMNKYGHLEGVPRAKYIEKEEMEQIKKSDLNEFAQIRGLETEKQIKAKHIESDGKVKVTKEIKEESKSHKEIRESKQSQDSRKKIKEPGRDTKYRQLPEEIDMQEAKERAKNLIDTLRNSQDPKEREVITSAIQTLFKSESFPISIKQNLIEETNAYFNEIKSKLEESLKSGEGSEEQIKLYQELVQSSQILNNILQETENLDKIDPYEVKQSSIKIPSIHELQSNPALLAETQTNIKNKVLRASEKLEQLDKFDKLVKHDEAVNIEKLDKLEMEDKTEKPEKVDKLDKTIKQDKIAKIEKPKKIEKPIATGKPDKTATKSQLDDQRKLIDAPNFDGVIEGKKILDLEKSDKSEKVDSEHEKLPSYLPDKDRVDFDIIKKDSEKSSSDHAPVLDSEGNIIEETPEKKQERIERKIKKETARKLIKDYKTDKLHATEKTEHPEAERRSDEKRDIKGVVIVDNIVSDKVIKPIKVISQTSSEKYEDISKEDKRETVISKPLPGEKILDTGFDTLSSQKSFKLELDKKEDVGIVSPHSSTAQTLLQDLFSTIENKLQNEKVESTDPQLISKILAEQFIASQIDPSQLGNISREMVQTFIEHVPMLESTKQGLEDILISNIENLILKFSDNKATSYHKKSEIYDKIQDVSIILKTLEIEPEKVEINDQSIELIKANEEFLRPEPLEMKFSIPTQITESLPVKPISYKANLDDLKKRLKQNMLNHLRKHFVKSKADLSLPTNVIEDLLHQKDMSGKDPAKGIQLALALYDISQDPLVNHDELMEMIASNSFSNLIVDMQNVLSHSLKQYDVPLSLDRSTTNLLLLLDIGIKDLEDFENEIQTFKPKYPNEVDFEKNPLSQLINGEHKLNISKNDIIIDNKLNFLRNVSSLKPVDKEKGFEMGLMIRPVKSEGELDNVVSSSLLSDKKFKTSGFPVMFNLTKAQSKKISADYKKKEELKLNITEIENVIKLHDRKIDMMQNTRDSLDSLVEMARDQKPGSKTKLMNLICKSPALKALASMGSIINISGFPSSVRQSREDSITGHLPYSLPSSPRPSIRKIILPPIEKIKKAPIGTLIDKTNQPDYFNKIEMMEHHDKYKQIKEKQYKRARKLSQLKKLEKHFKYKTNTEMKVHAKVERRLTNVGQPDIAELIAKKTEYYGSIDTLRLKIKEEITKEYSNFVKRIDFDALEDQPESVTLPEPILAQTKHFQRFYGKNTTLLPFIGKSKSLVGNILDQGLRALHFNLGPGTLVKAIMENQKITSSSDSKYDQEEWWDDGSKKIDNMIEAEHGEHSEPKLYLTNKQLMHCRMTARPFSIPAHEWSKVAISGTRRNLRPDLFGSFHKSSHCAYQVLAHKHLQRHGISIAKHLERYETLEVINKSLQENAYIRIQNSLLKCLMRVLEDK